VSAGRVGTVERTKPPPSWLDPLMRAVYRALTNPMGMRAIRARVSVSQALRTMRKDLVARKLLLPAWRRAFLTLVLPAATIMSFRSGPS
jgi:uncharacterized protein (TIGR04222 family)